MYVYSVMNWLLWCTMWTDFKLLKNRSVWCRKVWIHKAWYRKGRCWNPVCFQIYIDIYIQIYFENVGNPTLSKSVSWQNGFHCCSSPHWENLFFSSISVKSLILDQTKRIYNEECPQIALRGMSMVMCIWMVLLDGTVPSTNSLMDGTVLSINSLLDRTLKKWKFLQVYPTPQSHSQCSSKSSILLFRGLGEPCMFSEKNQL